MPTEEHPKPREVHRNRGSLKELGLPDDIWDRKVLTEEEYFLGLEEFSDHEEESRDRGVTTGKEDEIGENPRPRQDIRDRGKRAKDSEQLEQILQLRQPIRDRGNPPDESLCSDASYDDYVRPYFPPLGSEKPLAPFPEALKDTRKVENDKDLFETFSYCEANIYLLKLAHSIPRCKEFLKALRKIKKKQKGKHKKEAGIQQANFSTLDTGQDKHATPEMLGRPFLKMASAIMDVNSGPPIRKCRGLGVKLNIEHTKRHPPDLDPRSSVAVSNPS